jgi:hypothetical protein
MQMEARIINKDVYRHKSLDDIIDYSDKSLFDDNSLMLTPLDKEYYTPEEACEIVMREIQAIYDLKDAV